LSEGRLGGLIAILFLLERPEGLVLHRFFAQIISTLEYLYDLGGEGRSKEDGRREKGMKDD
jgi:hypothetical protein